MGHTDAAVPTIDAFVNLHQDARHAGHSLRQDDAHRPARFSDSSQFADFAATLRCELAPATTLEDVIVERVILAAWRLQTLSLDESLLAHEGKNLAPIRQETLRVECSLETALMLLEASRRARPTSWGRAKSLDTKVVEEPATEESEDSECFCDADYSNEWATLPQTDSDDVEEVEEEDVVESVRWEDRLNFDDNVSESSPAVKGTWVTATQVVSRIIDGWSWSDVLRSYPELCEADIRACLAYTVDQDGF